MKCLQQRKLYLKHFSIIWAHSLGVQTSILASKTLWIHHWENLNLADLKLLKEESRDIIEFLARKRNITNYKHKSSNELLQAIKKQSKNKDRIDTIRKELKE